MTDKRNNVCWLIDVACPFDTRIDKKENEKTEVYAEVTYEASKVWKTEVQKVVIVPAPPPPPVVTGALASVTKKLGTNSEMINFVKEVEPLQKASLPGKGRIIREVLDFGN